jgi:hypothetical protein
MCIILASRREGLHLYSFQVIEDLAVSTPHPWLRGHFEGTDRSNPLNMGVLCKTSVITSIRQQYLDDGVRLIRLHQYRPPLLCFAISDAHVILLGPTPSFG